MPRSRYPRPGQAIAPRFLSAFLERKAPCDAGRYCDLDASAWARFDAKTCKKLARSLVAELSKNLPILEATIGSAKLPAPHRSVSITELDLENRTFNCLQHAQIERRPGGIASLTISDALSLRGFGVKSLVDLITSLESLQSEKPTVAPRQAALDFGTAEPTPRGDTVDTNAVRPVIPKDFVSICKQPGDIPDELLECVLPPLPVGTSLHDLNLPLRTFNALAKAGFADNPERLRAATIRDLTQVYGLGDGSLVNFVDAMQRFVESRPRPRNGRMTVDEEILRLFVPSGDARRRAIVASYLGLEGHSRSTLESVGKKFKITRERVRQLCSPPHISKLSSRPNAPLLDSLLDRVRSLLPAPATSIEAELWSARLLDKRTRIENVLEAAVLLKRTLSFVVDVGPGRLVAEARTVKQMRKIIALAAKLVAKFGAVTIADVRARAAELTKGSVPINVIDAVVESCIGFRWLDEAAGYFWLDNQRPNMLRRRIRRVLSVAPRIAVAELRAAIRRDHRYDGQVPSVRVLLELCRQLPECRVHGSDVVAVDPDYPLDILRGDEAKIIGLLLEHGPVCQRDELQRLAVEAGIGLPSFWRCLSFCPTITRYARGVFGLTGAKVLPGEVESLIPPIPKNDVLLDHGWSEDGKVWIAYRLSENSIETGVIGVPASKRDYVQGEFELRSEGGVVSGTLVVKESSTWGFGGFLNRSGAEPGDIFVLQISQKERVAIARLGDDSLMDELTGD